MKREFRLCKTCIGFTYSKGACFFVEKDFRKIWCDQCGADMKDYYTQTYEVEKTWEMRDFIEYTIS